MVSCVTCEQNNGFVSLSNSVFSHNDLFRRRNKLWNMLLKFSGSHCTRYLKEVSDVQHFSIFIYIYINVFVCFLTFTHFFLISLYGFLFLLYANKCFILQTGMLPIK